MERRPPGPLGSTAARPSGAPEWPTCCPAQAPRGWGRGWRQPSAAGTRPPGGALLGLDSREPAAAGGPLGGRSGTGAGWGVPRAGRAAPIHGCRCRSSPCRSQRPVREKQKGGGQQARPCPGPLVPERQQIPPTPPTMRLRRGSGTGPAARHPSPRAPRARGPRGGSAQRPPRHPVTAGVTQTQGATHPCPVSSLAPVQECPHRADRLPPPLPQPEHLCPTQNPGLAQGKDPSDSFSFFNKIIDI